VAAVGGAVVEVTEEGKAKEVEAVLAGVVRAMVEATVNIEVVIEAETQARLAIQRAEVKGLTLSATGWIHASESCHRDIITREANEAHSQLRVRHEEAAARCEWWHRERITMAAQLDRLTFNLEWEGAERRSRSPQVQPQETAALPGRGSTGRSSALNRSRSMVQRSCTPQDGMTTTPPGPRAHGQDPKASAVVEGERPTAPTTSGQDRDKDKGKGKDNGKGKGKDRGTAEGSTTPSRYPSRQRATTAGRYDSD